MAIDKIILGATDNLFENTEFTGTEAIKPPVGTTAQRVSAASGDLRFNSTTNLLEYYSGSGWKSIDSPPVISSVSPSSIANSSTSVDITITGDFFASGATVKAVGQNGSEIGATSVTFTNSTTLVATFNGTSFSDAQEDYSIEVTNVSGLTGKGANLLAVNANPVWTVASGSLGTVYDSARTGVSITTGATDDEGASLTYSVSAGSLPSGLSINSGTGAITGSTSAVGSDTTVNFTLSVTDGTNATTRAYSILQKAPVIASYTSTGSGTFSVPTGVATVDVLVVGGGGSGAWGDSSWWGGGGGGAGGLIYRPAFPVTPGGTVSYTVGTGGAASTSRVPGGHSAGTGKEGQNSTFGTLTALGGGGGAGDGSYPANAHPQAQTSGTGGQGGSGGGGSGPSPKSYTTGARLGGSGQQPSQPGDSGTYGFGFHGGGGSSGPGGGGAGAGSNGGHGGPGGGDGGIGKQYDISGSQLYYGGGGGAAHYPGHTGSESQTDGTGGQGGGGSGAVQPTGGQNGDANRGGGSGGGGNATGGSGVVIVKY